MFQNALGGVSWAAANVLAMERWLVKRRNIRMCRTLGLLPKENMVPPQSARSHR
jgi:hypothetical protein